MKIDNNSSVDCRLSRKQKNNNNESFIDCINKKKLNQSHNLKTPKKSIAGRWVTIQKGIGRLEVISLKYADDSSEKNPIMCTSDGKYRTEINGINPKNASELEMAMYCAHLDSTGKGTGSKFGTYNDLKTLRLYNESKKHNPDFTKALTLSEDDIKNIKLNWLDLSKEYLKILSRTDRKQYSYHKKLNVALEFQFDGKIAKN